MPLPPHLHSLLGTVPDREIARLAGCSPENIQQHRTRAGIAPAPRPTGKNGGQVNVRFDAEDWAFVQSFASIRGVSPTEAVRLLVHEAGT